MSAATAIAHKPTPTAQKPESFERRRDGFTKIEHKYVYDMIRVSGPSLPFVMFVLTETDGAAIDPETGEYRKSNSPVPESSGPLSLKQFAWFANVDVRTAEMAVKSLCDNKVLLRKYDGHRGLYRYSAPKDTWAKLPDYANRKPPQSALALDSKRNFSEGSFAEIRVSAGVPTKPLPLKAPAERVQFECSGAAAIQHGVKNGVLHVKIAPVQPKAAIEQPAAQANGASNGASNGHAKLPSSYDMHFRVAWAEAGLFGSDWQHKEAEKQWNLLEIAEQMAAVQNVRDKTLSGEFQRYKPLPPNFFRKGMWQVPAQTKNQDAKKQESKKELFDWAREMDAKATRT